MIELDFSRFNAKNETQSINMLALKTKRPSALLSIQELKNHYFTTRVSLFAIFLQLTIRNNEKSLQTHNLTPKRREVPHTLPILVMKQHNMVDKSLHGVRQ